MRRLGFLMTVKKYSLKTLFRCFLSGVGLALLGSWLLSAFRLSLVLEALSLGEKKEVLLFLDFIFMSLAFFGLFMALAVLFELKARINRIDALGEEQW